MRNATLATMLVATVTLIPLAPAIATDPAAMDALISGAKTAADHDALASRYDQQAAAARAKAAEHRSMGQTYKSFSGGKGGLGASAMPQHCESLAKSFEEQARMYATMAATERELAKAAK
jgi:hypothetical protein